MLRLEAIEYLNGLDRGMAKRDELFEFAAESASHVDRVRVRNTRLRAELIEVEVFDK
ncbi:MAG: hypothetical protein QG664_764 [Patescibacteria group bacterium]|nr:hypothetical protein [Patescibacteria group bacterium]